MERETNLISRLVEDEDHFKEYIQKYIKSYFENVEESTLEQMLFDDFIKHLKRTGDYPELRDLLEFIKDREEEEGRTESLNRVSEEVSLEKEEVESLAVEDIIVELFRGVGT